MVGFENEHTDLGLLRRTGETFRRHGELRHSFSYRPSSLFHLIRFAATPVRVLKRSSPETWNTRYVFVALSRFSRTLSMERVTFAWICLTVNHLLDGQPLTSAPDRHRKRRAEGSARMAETDTLENHIRGQCDDSAGFGD